MKNIPKAFTDRFHSLSGRQPVEPEEETPSYLVHINSPVKPWLKTKTLELSGWLLPLEDKTVHAMRARNNDKYHTLRYGTERHDVVKAFPDVDNTKTLHSGFSLSFTYQDGTLELQVDFGDGWETVYATPIEYSPENNVAMLYNPNLSKNWAEHQNLLEGKKKYYYEEGMPHSYDRHVDDPRLVAFYLPQFHPIAENNLAWGKGFTEWDNVTTAQPRFVGHQQPLLPSELGFYDLRLEENIQNQIDLAKKHGIYGFSFYYYWFSGRRLLEKPLDIFLKNKDIDFNFMITWANENWTKRWDGQEQEVIVEQKYLAEDPLKFITDVEGILLDPRYIQEDGKPVLGVYRAMHLGKPAEYVKVWREYFRKKHGKELQVISVLGFDGEDPREYGFDAGLEFEPMTTIRVTDFNAKPPYPPDLAGKLLDADYVGAVYDYRQIACFGQIPERVKFPTYKSVTPSWDNDARRKGNNSTVFYGSNPDLYAAWLDSVLRAETSKTKAPLLFLNAWNEWAEGAVLEPSKFYGSAVLNRTAEVLAKYSKNQTNAQQIPLFKIQRNTAVDTAVVVHVFDSSRWRHVAKSLKNLQDIRYDLFVTVTEKTRDCIEDILAEYPGANISVVPNRGRDILPFIFLAPRLHASGYRYFLKLHTETLAGSNIEKMHDTISKLLPRSKKTQNIFHELQNGLSFFGPESRKSSLAEVLEDNELFIKKLLTNLYGEQRTNEIIAQADRYTYATDTMFWCTVDSITPLLDLRLVPEDFESESGQDTGTFTCAVKNLLMLLPYINDESAHIATSSPKGLIHKTKKKDA